MDLIKEECCRSPGVVAQDSWSSLSLECPGPGSRWRGGDAVPLRTTPTHPRSLGQLFRALAYNFASWFFAGWTFSNILRFVEYFEGGEVGMGRFRSKALLLRIAVNFWVRAAMDRRLMCWSMEDARWLTKQRLQRPLCRAFPLLLLWHWGRCVVFVDTGQ